MVSYSQQSDGTDHTESYNHRNIEAHTQIAQSPISQTTGDTSHRINLLSEDDRLFIKKHIADNTACSTRDTAHDDGYPKGETTFERLLDARNIEKRQAQGIKQKPGIVKTLEIAVASNHYQLRKQCTNQVDRAQHPKRTHTKHHISYGSTTYGYSHTTNKTAQPIIVLTCSQTNARKGKSKCSNEFYHAMKREHEFRIAMYHHFLVSVSVLNINF